MRDAVLVLVLMAVGAPAWAHKPSDSYLSITVQDNRIDGRWDIALRDLDLAIGLDADDDGAVTWGEVRAKHPDIAAYALSRLQLTSDRQVCASRPLEQLVDEHTDGTYSVLQFRAECSGPIERLTTDYRLLFDLDAQHRGLLRLTDGAQEQAAMFSPEMPSLQLTIGRPSHWRQIRQYGREGLWHIWTGFDHLLFLLALLLPAVLIRDGTAWKGVADFRAAWWQVVGVVTAFTAAHSITLTLATLGVVRLPSRLVESAIALSVAVAALANLYPGLLRRRWLVAFGFGLIHGFGFAGVLADLGLPPQSLLLSLVSFNAGVELGQLCIVAGFLSLTFLIRQSGSYQSVILRGGSIAVMLIAFVWFIERAFNLQLWPS